MSRDGCVRRWPVALPAPRNRKGCCAWSNPCMKFLRDITRGTYDSPRTPVLVLIYLHSETWLVNPAGPTGYTMWLGEGFSPTLSPSTVPHRISRTVQGASQLAAFVCARLCIWIVGVGSGMPRVTKSGWGNAPRECPLSGGLRYID